MNTILGTFSVSENLSLPPRQWVHYYSSWPTEIIETYPPAISLIAFPYSLMIDDTHWQITKCPKKIPFFGREEIPPISSTLLTWKLGSFSALSDCKSPTLRVADHFVNCCCAASSAFRIFSFYSVRCGFLDEFDFSCFRVFLCLQIDYYFAYSVKINQKWSRFSDF